MSKTTVTVYAWFSFGVPVEVDDPEDYVEIAEKGRPELIARITSDGISDCIEEVEIIPEEDE